MDLKAETTLTQEASEPEIAIPMVGGDMGVEALKANFNALLYLLTEQMAVQKKLLLVLSEKSVLSEDQTDAVLAVTEDKEVLTATYGELFARFVGYYSSVRQLLQDGKIFTEEELEKKNG